MITVSVLPLTWQDALQSHSAQSLPVDDMCKEILIQRGSLIMDIPLQMCDPTETGTSILQILQSVQKVYNRYWAAENGTLGLVRHPETGLSS